MADITCTITKNGRCDKYGRPLIVGSSYTGAFDEVRSLYLAGFATVADVSIFDDDSAPAGTYYWPIPYLSKPSYALKNSAGALELQCDGNRFAVENPLACTVVLAGDSLSYNALTKTGNNFICRGSEGVFNWLDATLGAPFNVLGQMAVGGKTCREMIDQQFPVIFAMSPKPRYVFFTAGLNDLLQAASVATTYARIAEAVVTLLNAGIIPIWSTVWHRAYDSVVSPRIVQLNDLLRQFACSADCGLFWDGAAISCDPTSANNEGRLPMASYYYDATIHPNNLLAYHMGRFAAAQLAARLPQGQFSCVGNEDIANSLAGSNLLSNPSFIGSGAASGTGVTGVFPTGWKVDWVTRTGTGVADCAIVSVTDQTTGLQIANGLQLTLSGSAASGDVLRVSQTSTENAALLTSLTSGNVVNSEISVSVATGANLLEVGHRVQANGNESTWAGHNNQTNVAMPATVARHTLRTFPLTLLGSGAPSAARFDVRATFSGAGTGTVITLWKPRFRKIS